MHQNKSVFINVLMTFDIVSGKTILLKVFASYKNGSTLKHHESMPINFDPLKPHFYIVKWGFTGVYIIFLISTQNVNYVYS